LRQAALFDLAESGWLAGASLLATANVALNLRLNALKRLFDVALQLGWVPPDQVAAAIIPQLDKLF
jgi:phycocyanobilin lyase alpha subunit